MVVTVFRAQVTGGTQSKVPRTKRRKHSIVYIDITLQTKMRSSFITTEIAFSTFLR